MHYKDESIYKGLWENDKRNGEGKINLVMVVIMKVHLRMINIMAKENLIIIMVNIMN